VKSEPFAADVEAVYVARDFAPIWLDGEAARDNAHALARTLKRADEHGLRPEDYLAPIRRAATEGPAAAEIALSRTLVRYGRDLVHGRVEPDLVEAEILIARDPFDARAVLDRMSRGAEIEALAREMARSHPGYERLRRGLLRLRSAATAGPWPTLPPGPTLEVGMRDPAVPVLRRQLRRLGDLPAADDRQMDAALFDDAVRGATVRFQTRHGLEPDGRAGHRTREALNVPLERRIEQVALNLERLRWINGDLGRRHVTVNLADFSLQVIEEGRPLFETRVVVGAPYHRTPVFSGTMTYVEINPYWNVPPGIARDELLPKIRDDPTWLVREEMEVLSDWSHEAQIIDPSVVDWRSIDPEVLAFKFRQKPGAKNALGRIKFMFPNRYDVYLHDTPARGLFSRPVRSFSHGCIRVEQPETLASILLGKNRAWGPAAIDAAIASGERQVIRLEEPVPVHLTYLTSWVDRSGTLHFRNDIYDRDRRLAEALASAS
jgi:murein L,D-transpeptidase YcbB/YkuD